MSTRKFIRATRQLLRQISRITRKTSKRGVNSFLRALLSLGRRAIWSQSGFVLPTTVLLILVVTLTVGAIGYRTYTRSQQTIAERQQRVIYNAATPAIDRAKAKLEFLFDPQRETRGGAVPGQPILMGMMINDETRTFNGSSVAKFTAANGTAMDPYTFPGEERIDINNDGALDNAWRYKADVNSDGDTIDPDDANVAYSIVFTSPLAADVTTDAELDLKNQRLDQGFKKRAAKMMVRNSPLSNSTILNQCQLPSASQSAVAQEEGWFEDGSRTTLIRKNFQVDAYVKPNRPDSAITTLEFQQDRQAVKGFKWAAWFRNDLEIFPGPQFNLNGAVHTEGNLIVGSNAVRFYMISSPKSCLYTKDASEITVTERPANKSVSPVIEAFTGQVMTGTFKNNKYEGEPKFDLWTAPGAAPTTNQKMTSTSDSVKDSSNLPLVSNIGTEPVRLQTDDVSQYTGAINPAASDATVPGIRDAAWFGGAFNKSGNGRVVNKAQATPYVDDTFRADDRYGPKPRYGDGTVTPRLGVPIVDQKSLTDKKSQYAGDDVSVGLDGYWERRARNNGLRLIVGQRLELGDLSGWGGPVPNPSAEKKTVAAVSREPLRPWLGVQYRGTSDASCTGNRCNEQRQGKAMIDNLAAVQSTAVYHFKSGSGDLDSSAYDFPVACLATTVHPGTAATLDKSATFENMIAKAGLTASDFKNGFSGAIFSDFFRGYGTNGWEYPVPPLAQFEGATGATPNDLGQAMRNLALFAGDPTGGTPSFEVLKTGSLTNSDVHPYPSMAMWGDFSVLRRILAPTNGGSQGKDYKELSIADKTTLHTAGCTLSMLAYNVNYLASLDLAASSMVSKLGVLGTDLDKILNASTDVPASARIPVGKIITGAGQTSGFVGKNGASDPESVIRLLEVWRDAPATTSAVKERLNKNIYLARLIAAREQVERDRLFGFAGDYGDAGDDFDASASGYGGKEALSSQCTSWVGAVSPLRALCSSRPRYPILYSLFPVADHTDYFPGSDHQIQPADVTASSSITGIIPPPAITTKFGEARDREDQPLIDVKAGPLSDSTYNKTALTKYKVVNLKNVAVQPKLPTDWVLKAVVKPGTDGKTPNSNKFSLIKYCAEGTTDFLTKSCANSGVTAKTFRVPFKDSVLYNGRELMPVRTLDIDIDLLRKAAYDDNYWLPLSGMVYAFREDAISEAHIVRPVRKSWATCDSATKLLDTTSECQMRTFGTITGSSGLTSAISAVTSTDPPLFPRNNVTPKPVDYIADPDRRPYGFRLKNGKYISRTQNYGDNGLSFISFNPIYVQGSFNLHQPTGTTTGEVDTIQEFEEKLKPDYTNFYTRNAKRDPNFTNTSNGKWLDEWRPSEVLGDAVSILSANFCDGSIADGFVVDPNKGGKVSDGIDSNYVKDRYGCNAQKFTSFHAQPLIESIRDDATSDKALARTNLVERYDTASPTFMKESTGGSLLRGESPVLIARDGVPVKQSDMTLTPQFSPKYEGLGGGKRDDRLQDAIETQVNMIMVSGIVPSRPGQSYGGLHNFPRFLENWGSGGKTLFISGSLVQLSFSTYAAAPFDQDQWQLEETQASSEYIEYYSPPARRWGYDVALQLAPAGPVAQRFKATEKIRSEFYSEPRLSDPYIRQLCMKTPGNTAANCP